MGKRRAREIWEYDSMAEFEADGGAAAYGDGNLIIAGQLWAAHNGFLRPNSDDRLLPYNNRVAVIGDSFDERMGTLSGTQIEPYAIWFQINAQIGHKLEFVHQNGVSGSGALQAPQYHTRIAAALATVADWVALRASVNDIHNESNTLQNMIDAYSTLFDQISAAGQGIITNTIPLTTLTNTTTKKQKRVDFNAWIKAQFAAKRWRGVVLTQDQYTNNGQVDTTLYADGTHPDLPASILLGASGAIELTPYINAPGWIDAAAGATGLVDASYYAKNPFNLGITGTKFARVTGQVPTGKSVSAPTDPGTTVCSLVPRQDSPGNWLELAITSTAIGQLIGVANDPAQRTLAAGGVMVGDTVQYGVEVEFPGDTGENAGYPVVQIQCKDAANVDVASGLATAWKTNSVHPAPRYLGGKRFTLVTPKLVVPATTTYFVLNCRFYNSGKAGEPFGLFTARVGRERFVNYGQ